MAIRIRTSQNSDFPGITSLWTEAFGDSEAAVSNFFRHFPDRISYVAEEDGLIVAMVHALPQILSPDTRAAYIYAVATRRSHRHRGLCRDLMAFAERALAEKGFHCCVLTPGEYGLFDYYQTLGYETAFLRHRTPFPGGQPISLTEYMTLREEILTAPHMIYDRATLNYAADVYGLTFYRTDTGIAAAAPGYTAEVLPQDTENGAAYAMIKWLTTPQILRNAYLGFALE